MALKFKNEAEFLKWRATLADKPKLRIAASSGTRVLVDDGAVVASAPARKTLRDQLPSRAKIEQVAAWFFFGVMALGLWGLTLCVAAAWGGYYGVH